jgi:hypothetical protein
MLSDIAKSWPPNPGPEEATTGYKQTHMSPESIFGSTELLDDLHEGAWWTGVKLITPAFVADRAKFSVKLVDREGRPFFEERSGWDQMANAWTPFPWPIPATFATKRGLRLRVSRVDCDEPLFMSMKTCFHEMSLMPSADPYIFINEEGSPLMFWNGATEQWGTRDHGSAPRWALSYEPIPPFDLLDGWNDNRLFVMRSWDSRLDLGPAAPAAAPMDVD